LQGQELIKVIREREKNKRAAEGMYRKKMSGVL
jgi:hypothetical protein